LLITLTELYKTKWQPCLLKTDLTKLLYCINTMCFLTGGVSCSRTVQDYC
jgi:hypothetical protein